MWQRMRSIRKDGVLAVGVAVSSIAVLFSAAINREYMEDYDCAAMVKSKACGSVVTKAKLNELRRNGIVVIDNVLDTETLRGAVLESRNMFNERETDASNNAADIRQDNVIWLRNSCGEGRNVSDTSSAVTRQPHLLSITYILRGVAHELSRDAALITGQLVVPRIMQLSRYNSKGGYRAHRDACTDSISELGLYEYFTRREYRERRYTAIIYINCATEEAVGEEGCLRCYMGAEDDDTSGDTSTTIRNIQPTGGRLVIFDSRQVLHEVVPFQDTARQRVALTSWIGEISFEDDVLEKRDASLVEHRSA